MEMYAIYDHPKDHPRYFVVRKWLIGVGTVQAGPLVALAETVEEARKSLPPGLTRMPRLYLDDPVIVEVWM